MHIRAYRPTDAAQTPAVFHAAVRRTAALDYTPEQVEAWAPDALKNPAPELIASWNARHLAPGTHTWIAEDDGAVLGFIDLLEDWRKHVYEGQPCPENSAYINLCFVHPDAAGQGVARALLEEALATARTLGVSEVWVHASRTSHGFFAHFGFEDVATNRVPLATPSGEVSLENFTMRLALFPAQVQD